jgi:hypothetical protein
VSASIPLIAGVLVVVIGVGSAGFLLARRGVRVARRLLRPLRPARPRAAAGGAPWITAARDPVPTDRGTWRVTVSWSAGAGGSGEVWVSQNAAPEARFSAAGEGSQVADWVQSGAEYHFRLYADAARERLLASTVVADRPTVEAPAAGAAPAQLPDQMPFIRVDETVPPSGDRPGVYTVCWSTGDGSPGTVLVSTPSSANAPMARAPIGNLQIDWIRPDCRYDFRLIRGEENGPVLATTVVQRARPFVRAEAGRAIWATGDGRPGRLYRVDKRGRERLVAEGAEGVWAAKGNGSRHATELRLYAGRGGEYLLAGATLPAGQCTSRRAFIRAHPNPVPPGEGNGKTTLSWSTGDGSMGQVYLLTGGKEIPVIEGAEGSHAIDWIAPEIAYRFRLYAGRDHKKIISSVTVSQTNQWKEIILDLAVLGAAVAPVVLLAWAIVAVPRRLLRVIGRRGNAATARASGGPAIG